jgi:hypothetical protein
MSSRVNKVHPALKHACYAATAVLPGENRAAFEKLHRRLIVDLTPEGPLEENAVETIARLLWRKQNLATFRKAELARKRHAAIRSQRHAAIPASLLLPGQQVITLRFSGSDPPIPAELEADRAAEDQARKELGVVYELVEIGEAAMVDCLLRDLEIEERLDAMINQQIKRLLHVRGLKSISAALPSAPPKGLPASTKAA